MWRSQSLTRPKDPKTKDFQSILSPESPKNKRKSQAYVRKRVDYLVSKFNAPQYESLFQRATWRLEDRVIDRITEAALSKKVPKDNPVGYFAASVKQEPGYK